MSNQDGPEPCQHLSLARRAMAQLAGESPQAQAPGRRAGLH